jgi:hypothetical protein
MKQPTAEDDDLRDKARRLLNDSDLMGLYWQQGHDHLWRRSWSKVRETVGGWLIAVILSGAAGAVIVIAVQRGWIK